MTPGFFFARRRPGTSPPAGYGNGNGNGGDDEACMAAHP